MSLAALRLCELSLLLSFVLCPYCLLCHPPQHQRNATISLFRFRFITDVTDCYTGETPGNLLRGIDCNLQGRAESGGEGREEGKQKSVLQGLFISKHPSVIRSGSVLISQACWGEIVAQNCYEEFVCSV